MHFEYRIDVFRAEDHRRLAELLNGLGESGWEAISAVECEMTLSIREEEDFRERWRREHLQQPNEIIIPETPNGKGIRFILKRAVEVAKAATKSGPETTVYRR